MPLKFLKAVFHNILLVHSWKICLIYLELSIAMAVFLRENS